MLFSRFMAVDLGLKRIKRLKSTSLSIFSAVLITITFILGTSIATNYLQSSVLISDLDDVLTDINIGSSLSDENYRPNLNILATDLNRLPYVNNAFIKFHNRGEGWRAENLIHHLWVNNTSTSTFDFTSYRRRLDILGFDNENFKDYVNLMNTTFEKNSSVLLNTNETIISHYLAQKMNLSINDTIFLHYVNWNGTHEGNLYSMKSYPLKVRNIISIPSKSNLAKDLLKNPFNSNNEGIIDELIILELETYLQIINYLTGSFGERFTNQLIFSIFLDREPIINSYNLEKSPLFIESIEKSILKTIRTSLPEGTVFYSENVLLKVLDMLESDIRQLQNTLFWISVPIFCFVFSITLYLRTITINNQINDFSVLICRGLDKKVIRRSFLIEGGVIGFLAAVSSIITCLGLTSILYFIVPNENNFVDWIYVFISNVPSYLLNAFFLGFLIGVGVNFFASRKIMKINPIDAVQNYHIGLISWHEDNRKRVRLIIIPLTFIVFFGIILEITFSTGFVGMFENPLLTIEDIVSDLFFLIPILLTFLIIVIITNRRDIFVKYMISFSFLLNQNTKGIMRSNYLRRPKNLSKLALIATIAFAMGITPIMLSQSAQDVSIRQIRRDIGSDIRITGTYEQLNTLSPSTLYNISSDISIVTPMIWVSTNIILANRTDIVSIIQTGILAVEPDNFVEATFFKDYFTPGTEPEALFSQLNSDEATTVAPIGFKNWELFQGEYIINDIGSVLPIEYDIVNGETNYLNFTIIGFFFLIPGFTQENFSPPMPLICSIDYLNSSMAIPPDSQMTWFIKINPKANNTIRRGIFQSLDSQFKDLEVFFVDKALESFLFTPIGSIVIIMDSMFFIVLAATLFGLSLTFFQTFNERRTEVAIYRSRGMNIGEIRKMFTFEILSIDSLGAIFGVILGFITALIYKDILISPWPKIPTYIFFPWPKIVAFLLLLTITHILSIFGQSYWSSRSKIMENLRIRD